MIACDVSPVAMFFIENSKYKNYSVYKYNYSRNYINKHKQIVVPRLMNAEDPNVYFCAIALAPVLVVLSHFSFSERQLNKHLWHEECRFRK